VGIYIMVPTKELSGIAKMFEDKKEKSSKQKDVPRKTTKEHLSEFSGNPGKKIGGRGFLVG